MLKNKQKQTEQRKGPRGQMRKYINIILIERAEGRTEKADEKYK